MRRSFDPYISHTIALHVYYLQKEISRFRSKILLQIFFLAKGYPELYVFISPQIQESG